ncbi:MAG: rRNA biogenesis protein rrp5, partial [Candelina submexicana]
AGPGKPSTVNNRQIKPSVLREEEVSFPRGGASLLTPLEHKQIQIEATRDVLFEQNNSKKAKEGLGDEEDSSEIRTTSEQQSSARKKPKSRRRNGEAKGAKEYTGVRIEGLSYKRLVPGSIVLGQVSQINEHDVALALPNNLTGYIPSISISEKITSRIEAIIASDNDEISSVGGSMEQKDIDLKALFTVGQYLRAYVKSTSDEPSYSGAKSKRHIQLSIDPRQANVGLSKSEMVVSNMVQASVASVEDHGLVLDLGLGDKSLKGFMSSKEVGHNVDHTTIEEGAVFLCMVTGLSSNGGIVKLSADTQKAGNVKKTNFLANAPTVDAFLPGTAVEFLVADVTPTGVAGKVMGMIDVTADLMHSGASNHNQNNERKFEIGSKVKGRIICTFPTVEPRKLGMSLLDHVLSLTTKSAAPGKASQPSVEELPLSTIVEAAKVAKVEPGVGLFVDCGPTGARGFVHISRVADGKIETLSETTGAYKLGSTHRARVTGYNAMDGLFLLSMEQKILDQPFLRIEDVQVGSVVKGKIEKLIVNETGVRGVLVNLAEGITGLVPETHLADIHLQHPEKKFKEGMSVTGRVLSRDLIKRQLRLTLKKTLVNTEDAVWSKYEDIAPGSRSPGTLVNVLPTGTVVQFYGNVRAFLPVSEMSEAYIQEPKQHFRTGQVVNVHAISIDPEHQKMLVSCRDPTAFSVAQEAALKDLKAGDIVNGVVIEKSINDIVVELQESKLKAIITRGHLADGSEQKSASTMKVIRVGQKLKDLLVLDKNEKKRFITLTNKPSMVKAANAGHLLTRFEDVRQGERVEGFVKNITSSGVFVQFGGGLTGLLLKRHLPEDTIQLPDFGMRREQSISTMVISVDHQQKRFLLSLQDMEESKPMPSSTKEGFSADRAVTNAVDDEMGGIDDLQIGKLTKAKITSVKDTQINVQLADNIQGRIDVSQLFDSWDDIKDRKHPTRNFTPKQILPVRILGVHDARNHRFLPVSHRTGRTPVFELSAKPIDQKTSALEILTLDQVQVGSNWVAYVNNISDECIWVNLSPNVRGRVRLMDVSDDISLLNDLKGNFPIGSALKVHVTGVDLNSSRLDLSARSANSSGLLSFESLSKGMVVPGRITKVTERQLMIQLSDTVSGPVNLIDLADDYSQANPTTHSKNEIVRVCVTDVDTPNKRLTLSTRPSRVLNSSLPVKDPEISTISQLKVNDVVRGFVKSVADNGVFVTLGANITAYIRISDLSDSYIKDWKNHFQVDQLVKGKVIAVDPLLNHLQMSLKASVIDKNYTPPITFNDIKKGQVVTGKVRKVEDFGVFIVVDGSSNVSGLCHRSEMADHGVDDVKKLYDEGDVVKAKVLKVDLEKRRINFGLKASYVQQDDGKESDADSDDEDLEAMEGVDINGAHSEDDMDGVDGGIDLGKIQDIDENREIVQALDDDSTELQAVLPKTEFAGLSTGGFDWTGGLFDQDDQRNRSEPDDETPEMPRKKKKKKPEIKVDRTGDLDAHGPQSVADFERLLLGQPDSSYLWLRYMAFQLQLSEVLKAREIAERAIRSINIREEVEKMNVWIALLNLENTYGSDETVEEVFKRACQYNDPQEIHERLISIYIQSGKTEKADELFQAMIKKFSQAPKVWINYATFLFDTLASPDRARALLPRAMQSLPQYAHLELTSKFAQLEFRSPNGDPERGRTIFEGLLDTFPKRLDLWNVLLDLEIKQGDKEQVRRLFGRVTSSKLKSRKAKFFFKRWLDYEEKQGDKKSIENVKARAAEYVRQQEAEQADH